MKVKKYILLFLFLSFCFVACKKYEDGTCISLRTKKARVTGVWEPEVFLVNGVDSVNELKADTCYGTYNILPKAELDHSLFTGSEKPGCGKAGVWHFRDNHRKLYTRFSGTSAKNTIIGPYGLDNIALEWTILRLTKNELWLSIDYLGSIYECHFKKIREL